MKIRWYNQWAYHVAVGITLAKEKLKRLSKMARKPFRRRY